MNTIKSQLPPEEAKNVEEEISESNNVVANKEPTQSVRVATNNLPRVAIEFFEFA